MVKSLRNRKKGEIEKERFTDRKKLRKRQRYIENELKKITIDQKSEERERERLARVNRLTIN